MNNTHLLNEKLPDLKNKTNNFTNFRVYTENNDKAKKEVPNTSFNSTQQN